MTVSAAGERGKNMDIEVLRAYAVGMVVLGHIGNLFPWWSFIPYINVVTEFWGGVDVFFCISGFVITSLLIRERREANGRFVAFAVPFWIRRIYRIWPSAIFWIVAVVVASLVFNRSGGFGVPIKNYNDMIAAILQVYNFHRYHCWVGSGSGMGVCGDNHIYWSLSLEEQFYMVFPFLFFFLSKKRLTALLLVLVAVQFFMNRQRQYFFWETRTDALAWGALIALWRDSTTFEGLKPVFLRSSLRSFITVFVLFMLICSVSTGHVIWFQTGVMAVLSAMLIWSASYNDNLIWPRKGILRTIMLWAGSRSFAIYLVHNFAFWTTFEVYTRLYPGVHLNKAFFWAFVFTGFGLTLLFSELNFRLLETPLRRKGVGVAREVRGKLNIVPVEP